MRSAHALTRCGGGGDVHDLPVRVRRLLRLRPEEGPYVRACSTIFIGGLSVPPSNPQGHITFSGCFWELGGVWRDRGRVTSGGGLWSADFAAVALPRRLQPPLLSRRRRRPPLALLVPQPPHRILLPGSPVARCAGKPCMTPLFLCAARLSRALMCAHQRSLILQDCQHPSISKPCCANSNWCDDFCPNMGWPCLGSQCCGGP